MATEASGRGSEGDQSERLSLNGTVVAVIEARMQEQLANLVRRYGGVPYLAPALEEVYDLETPGLRDWVRDLAGGRFDVLVFQTGVGTRALFRAAEAMGLQDAAVEATRRAVVVSRSPKPGGALRAVEITPAISAPSPYTTAEVIAALTTQRVPLRGRRVGIQEYGAPNEALRAWLEQAGATVSSVQPYRWSIPADVAPLLNLVRDLDAGRIPVVAFTSQSQVEHLFDVARRHGVEDQLRRGMLDKTVVASVGPVCTATLEKYGVKAHLEPGNPKMGPLVQEIARHFAGRPGARRG